MNNQSLATLFFEHQGKVSDKWEHYLSIYETEMNRFVTAGKPLRLLEIGVQNGGSLEIWAKYLPHASTIMGVDIDPAVQNLQFEGNVKVLVADVNDFEKVKQWVGTAPLDVVIDDGSHNSADIIAVFKNLFSLVAPGGKYVVEDLHASYWNSHGGGLRVRSSSMEYFKNIVDALNADHFSPDDCIPANEKNELQQLGAQIGRITFYDSVAVIEKLHRAKERPYRRLISGQHAPVHNFLRAIIEAPTELIQPWLLGKAAVCSIDLALKEGLQQAKREIEILANSRRLLELEVAAARDDADLQPARGAALEAQRTQNAALEEQLQNALTKFGEALARADEQRARNGILEEQLHAAAAKLIETQTKLTQAQSDINEILNSTSWRATAALRRAANIIRNSRSN
jgi:SAM-dependent methyltransferase